MKGVISPAWVGACVRPADRQHSCQQSALAAMLLVVKGLGWVWHLRVPRMLLLVPLITCCLCRVPRMLPCESAGCLRPAVTPACSTQPCAQHVPVHAASAAAAWHHRQDSPSGQQLADE